MTTKQEYQELRKQWRHFVWHFRKFTVKKNCAYFRKEITNKMANNGNKRTV